MNAERLLGHMIRSGLRTGGREVRHLSWANKAGLGLGALGLAVAAYEHFAGEKASGGAPPSPAETTPPPISRTPSSPPPPPLPQPHLATPVPGPSIDATHLIHAMIAAASADGVLDRDEEQQILVAARRAGLADDELEYLESEMNRPRPLFEIAAGAEGPQQAREVFAASLLAITVDNEAERDYLRQLAASLSLSAAEVAEVARELDRTLDW